MDTPKTLVMAALLALLLAAGCATQPNQHGIPNFGQTGPDRYHGGELTDAGRAWLAANGVTNIIRLDGGAEPGGWAAVVAEPISTWEQWFGGAAMDGKIVRAVAFLAAHPGTYLHCAHGKNRTMTAIGIYLVECCGWTVGAAQAEMARYGWEDSFPGLKVCWRKHRTERRP